MGFTEDAIMGTSGVVIRQETQALENLAQAFGVPYEKANRYAIKALPTGRRPMRQKPDPEGWQPTTEELYALDTMLLAREESSLAMRCILNCLGCGNLRPLTMHFDVRDGGAAYVVKRPFQLGGGCCCPLVMEMFRKEDGQEVMIGRVREDFESYFAKCLECCCLCKFYTDVERAVGPNAFEQRYKLVANLACCGRNNNCCGATCCANDMIFDILDTQGKLVGTIQKTYAPGGSGCDSACCRCCGMHGTYLISFTEDQTVEDRMLLLTSVLQLDYQHNEKKGNENDN